ncbi:acyl-CoA dehydrogenase family protein, partial [Streptomyces prunicolor]|uniref:acyl-CoA dehydrogenase family protein n=1 Tax=Streptomyces prunicolor TaxID=67348 RepID=UPI0033F4D73A
MDMGSEQQKRERVSAAIRGDEILVQFLSEPSGGSDLAGLVTRADRDGDTWVLNGAKTWSTCAYAADYALCLARTDWDAPKHRGLTMFLVKVHQPGITMRRITQVSGSTEFCEEFFDDLVLPADAVVGEVNGGWAVASRQLFHERTAVGGGSPFTSGRGTGRVSQPKPDLVQIARASGRTADPRVREMLGEGHALEKVQEQLIHRVSIGLPRGDLAEAEAGGQAGCHGGHRPVGGGGGDDHGVDEGPAGDRECPACRFNREVAGGHARCRAAAFADAGASADPGVVDVPRGGQGVVRHGVRGDETGDALEDGRLRRSQERGCAGQSEGHTRLDGEVILDERARL